MSAKEELADAVDSFYSKNRKAAAEAISSFIKEDVTLARLQEVLNGNYDLQILVALQRLNVITEKLSHKYYRECYQQSLEMEPTSKIKPVRKLTMRSKNI